jgi:hypothetical protein
MRELTFWRAPRFITMIAVAALHLLLIALILLASDESRAPNLPYRSVELIYIPSVRPPPVRAESGRPLRLHNDIALSPPLPVFDSTLPGSTSTGVGSRGSGVDWQAEAHRAIKAYEIRRDHPSDSAVSGKAIANDWWPQDGPHAGDSYKNEAGDWIVWIDADCYKVARWHSLDPASDAAPPDIVCPRKSDPVPAPHQ